MEFVNGKDDIPYITENKIHVWWKNVKHLHFFYWNSTSKLTRKKMMVKFPSVIKNGLLENPEKNRWFLQRMKPPWLVRGFPIQPRLTSSGACFTIRTDGSPWLSWQICLETSSKCKERQERQGRSLNIACPVSKLQSPPPKKKHMERSAQQTRPLLDSKVLRKSLEAICKEDEVHFLHRHCACLAQMHVLFLWLSRLSFLTAMKHAFALRPTLQYAAVGFPITPWFTSAWPGLVHSGDGSETISILSKKWHISCYPYDKTHLGCLGICRLWFPGAQNALRPQSPQSDPDV